MVLSLMLDEPVSPTICAHLYQANVDAYHVRDRHLLGSRDDQLWGRAQGEQRAIVTTNGVDFRQLAAQQATHHGVVVIPPYGTRQTQLGYVMSAVNWTHRQNALLPSLRDLFIVVEPDLVIRAEILVATPPPVAKTIA